MVAGAGLIGRRHIANVGSCPRAAVVAIADPAPSAQRLGAELGVSVYDELERALADQTPDGVIIATPNQLHLSGALACIERRIPVLIEKPVVDSVASLNRLHDALAANPTPTLVGHHRRHGAALRAAKVAIDAGVLGRIVTVQGSAQFVKPSEYFAAGLWRTKAGGGPILLNLIHEMDTLRFLVGEVESVQALASNRVRGFAVEDSAAVLLRFASGTLGTFVLSDVVSGPHSWELASGENPEYPANPDVDSLVVGGTLGTLSLPTMRTWRYDGDPNWWSALQRSVTQLPSTDPLAAEIEHFMDLIEGRTSPICDAVDGGRSFLLVEAVLDAARTGRPVHLQG